MSVCQAVSLASVSALRLVSCCANGASFKWLELHRRPGDLVFVDVEDKYRFRNICALIRTAGGRLRFTYVSDIESKYL
jgi:hypothetical protein